MNKPDEHTIYYRLKLGQDEYAGETVKLGEGIKGQGCLDGVLPSNVLNELAKRLDAVIECEGKLINYDDTKVLNVTEEHEAKAEQGVITFGPFKGANACYINIKVIRV